MNGAERGPDPCFRKCLLGLAKHFSGYCRNSHHRREMGHSRATTRGDMRDLLAREPSLQAQCDDVVDAAGAEQRHAPRVGVVIRAAKLLTGQGEYLCVLRDVSETGFKASIFHELPDCDELQFELQNGECHAATLVWQDCGHAGFRFVDPVDLTRLLANPAHYARRPIRLMIEGPGQLQLGPRTIPIALCDISQHGAKIACDERLPLSARVSLQARGLPAISARVRWRRDGKSGLVFEETMEFAQFAVRAHAMQAALRANP